VPATAALSDDSFWGLTMCIWNRTRLAAALFACMTAFLAAQSAEAQTRLSGELVRKAEAREDESGFCGKVNWADLNRNAYVRWLDGATVGTTKVNKFGSGQCQYDEVTRISSRSGRKCVHYTFYACVPGKNCGVGRSVECKKAGDWERSSE
jgi:hypothetical protein